MTRTLGRRCLQGLTVACLLLLSVTAVAGDHLVEQAWFEDPSGTLGLDEIRRQPLQRFEGSLARGFGENPLWVRLRIDPRRGDDQDVLLASDTLVLRVRSTLLLEARLHDPLAPGRVAVAGLAVARSSEPYASPDLTFSIPRGEQPRDLWLRLSSHHTRFASFEVLPVAEAFERAQHTQAAASAYLGVLLLTAVWALLGYLAQHDRLVLFFVVKQLGALGYACTMLGYTRLLLAGVASPALTDLVADVTVLANTVLTILFCHALLTEYRPPRWGMRLLLGCALVLPLGLPLLLDGRQMLVMQAHGVISIFASALLLPLAAGSKPPTGHDAPPVPVRALVGIFAVVLCLILMVNAGIWGLSAVAGVALYGAMAATVLLSLLLLVFLYVRTARIGARQKQTLLDLAIAQSEVAQERVFREDREKLLAMLGHEIKTPLSTLRLGMADSRDVPDFVGAAIADIDGIVERCVQLGLVEGARIVPRWTSCELLEVLTSASPPEPQRKRIDWSSAAPSPLTTDRQILEVILRNLLDNACKYSPKASVVRVGSQPVARDGRRGVEVSVESEPGDAGWPEPAQLFRKYYRAPHARRSIGSGLGLYLVAGLAEVLGAVAEYQPTGTHVRFTVWLPLEPPGSTA